MHALAILFAVTKHLVRILTTTSDIGTLEFTSYALQVCGLIFYFYFDVVGAWVCVVVGGGMCGRRSGGGTVRLQVCQLFVICTLPACVMGGGGR
jgi:hypothetical protein